MLVRHRSFLVPVIVLLAACSHGADSDPSDSTAGAIAGAKADPHDAAVVALRAPGGVTCTGVLVAPRTVLSSRGCVTGRKPVDCLRRGPAQPTSNVQEEIEPAAIEVLAGEDVTHVPPVARGVHLTVPDSPRVCGADIALLEIDGDVPGATPIAVGRDAAVVGEKVRVVGYGIRKTGGPAGRRAARTALEIASVGPSEFVLPTSACEGDEGAPAIDEKTGRVIGVASRAAGDCSSAYAQAVFTRADAFASMLASVAAPGPGPDAGAGGASGAGGAAGKACSSAHHCPKGFHCNKEHVCEPKP